MQESLAYALLERNMQESLACALLDMPIVKRKIKDIPDFEIQTKLEEL